MVLKKLFYTISTIKFAMRVGDIEKIFAF